MPQFRAIGFDLGETLLTYAEAPLNWVSLYRPALARVSAVLEVTLTEAQFNAAEDVLSSYNTRLNPRIREIDADKIFSNALASWPAHAMIERARAIETFFGFFQQSLRVYDDTLPTLQRLRSRGLLIGVLTDVPYGMPRKFVQNDLASTGLTSSVDVLLTSVDVGFRKPAPEGFHRLAAALDVSPAEMIYVGNEPKDIAGANAAGMTAVLIDREKNNASLGQAETVHQLGAIFGLLDSRRA